MAFPLRDVRYLTRRAADQLPAIHPRLLRDRTMLPKIDIAIQYFESMLGHERREMDTEVLVHFFGDHKVARCMVTSLARSYRFRARRIEELVSGSAIRQLRKAGLDSSRALRLRLYDKVNDFGHGYLSVAGRDQVLGQLESELRLRSGDLERLLYLDAPEHALLTRLGREPEPEDVMAQFNLGVLTSLLRHAEAVELVLSRPIGQIGQRLRDVASHNGVDVQISSRGANCVVVLRGRQDSLGSWVRYGRKVARTVLELLERCRPDVVDGSATLALRGRRARLRLSPEVLDTLGGLPARCTGWDAPDGEPHDATLAEAAQALRSPQQLWGIRRHPEPQAFRSGVLLPGLLARSGAEQHYLYAVRSPVHAERLAGVSPHTTTGESYVFVGETGSVAPLVAVGARVLAVPRFDRASVVRALRSEFASDSARRQGGQAA